MTYSKICNENRIRHSGEFGLFSVKSWVEESKGKLTSSKYLREIAKKEKLELIGYLQSNTDQGRQIYKYDHPVQSTNKSSFLLLGYAIELLLKSGIVSLLINSPKDALKNQVKEFGHNLNQIAEALHIPLDLHENDLLRDLSSFIVCETRYPIFEELRSDYCIRLNAINLKLSNDIEFDNGVQIYEKVNRIIEGIDGTQDNPKSMFSLKIDNDGFLTFRSGGTIPPVCIIKYSANQKQANENSLEFLKELLHDNIQSRLSYSIILNNWDCADFYEVIGKEGKEKIRTLKMSNMA